MGDAWDAFLARCQSDLDALAAKGQLRDLRDRADGGDPGLIDLSHNDYLGLRHDPVFQEACRAAVAGWPVGAGASRLLGGEWSVFAEAEAAFAAFKGGEAALYFGSGYAANEALPAVLATDPDAAFFSDKLNHASTVDGFRLADVPAARRFRYPHGDWVALERRLAASPHAVNYVFSETLFSMDGDVADLKALAALAARYRGVLVLDEAHATGCYGPRGAGLIAAAGIDPRRVLSVSTCGKALGVQGAFVVGPRAFLDRLVNRARPFIFATAPSPWLAAALGVAIPYVAGLDERRAALHAGAARMRQALADMGFRTGASSSFIIPVLCGDNARALALSSHLARHGIRAKAIRSPTVALGTERVRLSWHAGLDRDAEGRVRAAFAAFPPFAEGKDPA